jgi:hypothetical protein
MHTRRSFLAASSLAMMRPSSLLAQALAAAPTTRPNITEIDRGRILAGAARALGQSAVASNDTQGEASLEFSLNLPALAAAILVDPDQASRYSAAATTQLQALFVDEKTRLASAPAYPSFEPILDAAPLAEVAVSLPFLGLQPGVLAEVKGWFAEYLIWLTESRTALLARDARNHHASSWLLQVSAMARLTGNEAVLSDCRHRFKTSTLRAQVNDSGLFMHELTTENPFRNSLFNLDLLAGVCVLLSTRFENIWEYELQDGPGMRSAIARHAVYIRDRVKWPYQADLTHFKLLPYRRPALVFAGRAFAQADYVTLWRTLDPDPTDPEMLRTFPIRQPILWLPLTRS